MGTLMHLVEQTSKPQRLLRLPQVEDLSGLGRSSIYAAIKAGTFPKPVKLSVRAVAWRESDIAQWQNSRAHAGLARTTA
jgi:prophage regulatory protein